MLILQRLVIVGVLLTATMALAEGWDVKEFAKADTIEIRTNVPGEGEYWFKVWVVVVENEPYVRLGSTAGDRFQKNDTFPEISIRLNGKQFDRVRGEPVPVYADKVNVAMGEKYWSDLFIRWFPHNLVLRLAQAKEPEVTR